MTRGDHRSGDRHGDESRSAGWLDASMVYGSNAATAAGSARAGRPHANLGGRQPADRQRDVRGGRCARGGKSVPDRAADAVHARAQLPGRPAARRRIRTGAAISSTSMRARSSRAEIAHITYAEFLPHLLGPDAIAPYSGYDPNVDPRITLEFAGAAFRFGHSIVSAETGTDRRERQRHGRGAGAPRHVLRCRRPTSPPTAGADGFLRHLASDAVAGDGRPHRRGPAQFPVRSARSPWISPRSTSSAGATSASARSIRRARHSGSPPIADFEQITDDPGTVARFAQPRSTASIRSTCGPADCPRRTHRVRWSARPSGDHRPAVREPARRRPALVREPGLRCRQR